MLVFVLFPRRSSPGIRSQSCSQNSRKPKTRCWTRTRCPASRRARARAWRWSEPPVLCWLPASAKPAARISSGKLSRRVKRSVEIIFTRSINIYLKKEISPRLYINIFLFCLFGFHHVDMM